MTTATFVAHCASEEYDENERLRRRATARRRWGLGFSYLALILVTILMVFPLLVILLVSFTPNAVTQTWPPEVHPIRVHPRELPVAVPTPASWPGDAQHHRLRRLCDHFLGIL